MNQAAKLHTRPLSLKEAFAYLTKPEGTSSPTPLLQNMAGVGAIEGYWLDELWLESSLSHLEEAGIFLRENFNYETINFDSNPKRDFLDPDLNLDADLIVICNVFSPPQSLSDRFNLSPHHFKPGAWEDAALRAKAKIVVIQGTEFPPSFFMAKGNFVPLNRLSLNSPPTFLRKNSLSEYPQLRLVQGFEGRESVEIIPEVR